MSVVAGLTRRFSRTSFFPSTTGSFTIMGKVLSTSLPDNTNKFRNIAAMNAAIAFGNHFVTGTSSAEWFITTTTTDYDAIGKPSPVANRWYDVAFVRDGNLKTLYVDGIFTVQANDANAGNTTLVIGDYDTADTNDEWQGNLSGFKIWSVALSPQELAVERYNVFPAVQLSAVLGVYPFFSIRSDELDFSGHSRTLTVAGTFTTAVKAPNQELYVPRRKKFLDVPTATRTWPGYVSSYGGWQ